MKRDMSDKNRLLLGAGFVFGVAFTMLVLAVVTATVASRALSNELVITLAAGIFFAAVLGVTLYFLAFPENRMEVPVGDLLETDDEPATEPEES